MSQQTQPSSIGVAVPRSAFGRRLLRLRAFLRHPELDAALAAGADPWSSSELMVRAVQLGELAHRRSIGANLIQLVAAAERRRSSPPHLRVRRDVVLAEREALLALAAHVGRLEPVDVALTAELTLLVTHPDSPVFVGGREPATLEERVARCLDRLG
jgi:hypothetical protein